MLKTVLLKIFHNVSKESLNTSLLTSHSFLLLSICGLKATTSHVLAISYYRKSFYILLYFL